MSNYRWLLVMMIAVAVAPGSLLAQQAATITGRVTGAEGEGVAAATVRIPAMNIGVTTGPDGRYTLPVPAGRIQAGQQVQLTATRVGFGTQTRAVTLTAGATVTQNFQLAATALQLEALVVTGVSAATPTAKLPFTVGQVSAADLPVPAVSAGGAIQGKIAGAQVVSGTGRPGAAPSILLRGPTSINTQGRSQEPLYIVDGVILGGGSIADIDAGDIESVEVVKGAAAASLYGSRASNGVIQITTRSGRSLQGDVTRYSVRTEYGINQLDGSIAIAQNHPYRLNAAGTAFVTAGGMEFDWVEQARIQSTGVGRTVQPRLNGINIWNTFQDQLWPGGTVDHVSAVFDPGNFSQSQATVEGRSGNTNFLASFNNTSQDGVITGLRGFDRSSFRVNLDQELRENLRISTRTFYSTSTADGQNVSGGGSALFNLTRMPAGVPLNTLDLNGELVLRPDITGENANPLISIRDEQRLDERSRFLGGFNLVYTPITWLDVIGNFSYDRSNVQRSQFNPRGFRTGRPSSTLNMGRVFRDAFRDEALNASVDGVVRWNAGDLRTRTTARYLYETSNFNITQASGSDLVTSGIPSLNAVRTNKIISSSEQEIRSSGYYLTTNLDFRDRYIVDLLVRRDGSSLFGADERWQTYYRGAAAYLLSEEPWWNVPGIDNAKLRYSVGTAGGRPRFNAQYETFAVSDGVVRPVNLGNASLKPEFVIEQEGGVDMRVLGRVSLGLTYAQSEARDQILRVPLAGYTGFVQQWQNAGTLNSNTWEASIESPIIERGDFTWTSRFLFDRTRQKITKLNVPEYQYGFPQQGLSSVFFAREGEPLGRFYGVRWATGCTDLPSGLDCSQFQVNDDGYLVYVGSGNAVGEGITKNLWGTTGPTVRGLPVRWGVPIASQDADGNTLLPLGTTMPNFNFSVANTIDWRGFSVYGLVDATMGANIYNLPRHWSYFERYSGDQDQAGRDEATKKPIGYHSALYNQLEPPNSHFVEDGSFVKLREVALRYRFGQSQLRSVPALRALDGIGLSLVGRNLFTWTNYSGFDPEVGFAGGDVGSAAIARFDGFGYPNFRSFTAAIELNF